MSDNTMTAARICVRVLEEVSVGTEAGGPVLIGSLQQKILLTLLVAAKGRSVCVDTIADELWPDERPARWRGCIATLANSIRKTIGDGDFVHCTARGYTLHRSADAVRTDVDELHECVTDARLAESGGEAEIAETKARRALEIYGTGPWATDYWGWNEAAAEAARILGATLLARGAYVSCISELSPRIDDFDWHDGVWACLVLAHHRLGNSRRAQQLAARAKLAVGAPTPLLAHIEHQITDRVSHYPPSPLAHSA